jgi:hypothetical protein
MKVLHTSKPEIQLMTALCLNVMLVWVSQQIANCSISLFCWAKNLGALDESFHEMQTLLFLELNHIQWELVLAF